MVTARSHSHPRLRSMCPGPPARILPVQAAPPAAETSRRFDRQLTIPGFGVSTQRRLSQATVLVAGVGGVGEAVAAYLAAAGVGRLILIHPGDLADPAVPGLIAEADAVVDARHNDARHNFPERYLINRLCVRAGVPLVVAAMNATETYLLVVRPGEPCLRCVFGEGDPAWEPLGFPVLGAVAGTVGALAATEALKVVGGFAEPAAGCLGHLDRWDVDLRTPRTRRDPACPDCGPGSTP